MNSGAETPEWSVQGVLERRNAVEPWRRWLAGTAEEYATLAATAAAHHDPIETGKLVVETVPDPAADVFEGRHFQTDDLIQVMVVEFGAQFVNALRDLIEIAYPILLFVGLALEGDLSLERVAVEPRITVAVSHVHRQVVGSLERKFLEDFEHLCALCLGSEGHTATQQLTFTEAREACTARSRRWNELTAFLTEKARAGRTWSRPPE